MLHVVQPGVSRVGAATIRPAVVGRKRMVSRSGSEGLRLRRQVVVEPRAVPHYRRGMVGTPGGPPGNEREGRPCGEPDASRRPAWTRSSRLRSVSWSCSRPAAARARMRG